MLEGGWFSQHEKQQAERGYAQHCTPQHSSAIVVLSPFVLVYSTRYFPIWDQIMYQNHVPDVL